MHFAGIGHSHIVALAKGAHALQGRGATVAGAPIACRFHYLYDSGYQPTFVGAGDDRALNPAILDAAGAGAPQFLLMSAGGNQHNVLSIAQPHQRFDFILGENPDAPLDEAGEIIPESVVRETLRSWMADDIALLRALRAATAAPMIQIEPPPPLPRAHVLAHPGELLHAALDQRKMSSDLLRHKMWRVQSGLLRETCRACGVLYVETAPDMIDAAGMLHAKACGKDATHANEIYGAAMVGEALRRATGDFTAQA